MTYPGTYADVQCHPCTFCGTGKMVAAACTNTADGTCADQLCRAVPAVAHALVALTTCDKFKQCATNEAVTGCAKLAVCDKRMCDPTAEPVCGMYGAVASVTCVGGWSGDGQLECN